MNCARSTPRCASSSACDNTPHLSVTSPLVVEVQATDHVSVHVRGANV